MTIHTPAVAGTAGPQLIVYIYAVIGIWWFGGKLEEVPEDVYSIPEANFSACCFGVPFDWCLVGAHQCGLVPTATFFNSFATLFQLMVGESWNDVMVAAIYATHSLLPMWFFCSYIILLLLLLANVLTGIICDRFSNMEDDQEKVAHRLTRERNEIEACAARVIQRLFLRKVAVRRVWASSSKRRHQSNRRPNSQPKLGARYRAKPAASYQGAVFQSERR